MSSRRRRRSVTADGMTPLDPDRTLALSYVPAKHRPAVEALWRLDAALGAGLAGGREPLLGQIKLVWWGDALEKLARERDPGDPVFGRGGRRWGGRRPGGGR